MPTLTRNPSPTVAPFRHRRRARPADIARSHGPAGQRAIAVQGVQPSPNPPAAPTPCVACFLYLRVRLRPSANCPARGTSGASGFRSWSTRRISVRRAARRAGVLCAVLSPRGSPRTACHATRTAYHGSHRLTSVPVPPLRPQERRSRARHRRMWLTYWICRGARRRYQTGQDARMRTGNMKTRGAKVTQTCGARWGRWLWRPEARHGRMRAARRDAR